MRSASIGSTRARAHSRSSASVAGGERALRRQLGAERVELARGVGRSPCQSSHVVSSNVACAASSPTGKPAMISSPRFAVDVTEPRRRRDDAFESVESAIESWRKRSAGA